MLGLVFVDLFKGLGSYKWYQSHLIKSSVASRSESSRRFNDSKGLQLAKEIMKEEPIEDLTGGVVTKSSILERRSGNIEREANKLISKEKEKEDLINY